MVSRQLEPGETYRLTVSGGEHGDEPHVTAVDLVQEDVLGSSIEEYDMGSRLAVEGARGMSCAAAHPVEPVALPTDDDAKPVGCGRRVERLVVELHGPGVEHAADQAQVAGDRSRDQAPGLHGKVEAVVAER